MVNRYKAFRKGDWLHVFRVPVPLLKHVLMDDVDENFWGDRESMIAIALRIVHNRHDAEDVVQATLLAAWKLSDQIDPSNRIRYVNRAIRLNAIKRRLRQRSYDQLENHEVRSPAISHLEIEPIDLEEAIQSLPEAQQQVIRMRYYAGMTFAEIGATLTISLHTAASRCRYAIDKLKELFQSDTRKPQ